MREAKLTRIPAKKNTDTGLVRVAVFARVSTASEAQLSSLPSQVSYYSALIQSAPGWVYAGVCIGDGITGITTTRRQGLADLLDVASTGRVDIVLVKSISLLARNTLDLLSIIRELKSLGMTVQVEREHIDTTIGDGELLLTLLDSFAQEESRPLSENVKWAIRRRYQAGGTNSFWFYGYGPACGVSE